MSSLKSTFLDIDFAVLGASLGLVVIGILSIYSSGITAEGLVISHEYLKQLLWSVVGMGLLVVFILQDYRRIKDYSFIIYCVFLAVLLYTRFFGKVVNGARSWIGIGDLGIQPSEFGKLVVILFLAHYLESSEHDSSLRRLAISFLIIALPVGLILSQPDFGTSLVYFPILLFMVYIAGLDRRYIVFILLAALLTFGLTVLPLWEKYILDHPTKFLFILYQMPYVIYVAAATFVVLLLALWGWLIFKRRYYFWIAYSALLLTGAILASILAHKALKEYQIMRLIVFMDPSIDPRGSGWNILQSITAIGSGGFLGKGYLQGTQSHYQYIPQQSTDFIFSIVAEEWGFLGGLAVFGLFLVLLLRCTAIMQSVRDRYALFVVAGIMGMLFFHFMINAGMAMGIMPITGIPLFFLSYGGSSLWTVLSAMGLLLGISARRYHT